MEGGLSLRRAATNRGPCGGCIFRSRTASGVPSGYRRCETERCRLSTCSPSIQSPRRPGITLLRVSGRAHCADAVEHCFSAFAGSPAWVLEGDIKGCFDNIDHDWLLRHVPTDKSVLRKWLKSGYFESGVPRHGERHSARWRHLTGRQLGTGWAGTSVEGSLPRSRQRVRAGQSCPGSPDPLRGRLHRDGSLARGPGAKVKPTVEAFLRERGLKLS